jgi:predicted CXXCH cytochrome family protein
MFRWLKIVLITVLLSLVWFGSNGPARAEGPGHENEQCLTCHSNPDLTVEFPEGDTISAYVSGTKYNNSVHGQQEMTCAGCHPNHEEYPHPDLAAADSRTYALELNNTCFDCHPEQAEEVKDSMHAELRAQGHPEAAVCVDCHGAHDTLSLHESRVEIAVACRQCHSTIYDDYYHSSHGHALREENNQDVPTCVDCHGSHTFEDPRTTEFRLKSPQLCGSCHADEALMAKYGISTDVFNTYVADFHGTTVTLFEKQAPDAATNKAVCYDCHGVHAIRAVDDPEAAVIKQNLLETCQRCHPDATANFPDSWTSHFPSTFEKQPLVATVNLFYLLFIPGTIGFMLLLVFTDAGRAIISRGKKHPPEDESAVTVDDEQEESA